MKYYIDALKKYAQFSGRASRSQYWYFVLVNFLVSLAIGFVEGLSGLSSGVSVSIVGSLYSLVVIIPSIAVAVRRMHDVNKSGWFILIPIYNIILAFGEGDKGENQYGPVATFKQ